MTPISPATLKHLMQVITTAKQIDIHAVVLEPDRIRGINELQTAFILDTSTSPEMEFQCLAMSNTALFMSRYDLVKDHPNLKVSANLDTMVDGNTYVRALQLKAGKTTIDYRCANPLIITSPKNSKTAMMCSLTMTPADAALIMKAKSAMAAETVSIAYTETGVSWYVSDINGDKLVTDMTDKPIPFDMADSNVPNFKYDYPIKSLAPMIQHSSRPEIHINLRGFLNVQVRGLDMYVRPTLE